MQKLGLDLGHQEREPSFGQTDLEPSIKRAEPEGLPSWLDSGTALAESSSGFHWVSWIEVFCSKQEEELAIRPLR